MARAGIVGRELDPAREQDRMHLAGFRVGKVRQATRRRAG